MIASLEALHCLIATLKSLAPDIVPIGHISAVEPERISELPHITVSAAEIDEAPIGIGGVLLLITSTRGKTSKSTGVSADMTLLIDVLAKSKSKVDDISEKVTGLLFDNRVSLRRSGFIIFSIKRIGEIVSTGIPKTKAASLAVWKRRLEYRCVYEQVLTVTEVPKRIIGKSRISIAKGNQLDG